MRWENVFVGIAGILTSLGPVPDRGSQWTGAVGVQISNGAGAACNKRIGIGCAVDRVTGLPILGIVNGYPSRTSASSDHSEENIRIGCIVARIGDEPNRGLTPAFICAENGRAKKENIPFLADGKSEILAGRIAGGTGRIQLGLGGSRAGGVLVLQAHDISRVGIRRRQQDISHAVVRRAGGIRGRSTDQAKTQENPQHQPGCDVLHTRYLLAAQARPALLKQRYFMSCVRNSF
ncbi:MAG: hypothetical protein BWY66_00170 [bacterium ADurb.Bin374]|nr:MAG: hypothetical protein BWY66_00170 [bacterium ADurb.Bin374]